MYKQISLPQQYTEKNNSRFPPFCETQNAGPNMTSKYEQLSAIQHIILAYHHCTTPLYAYMISSLLRAASSGHSWAEEHRRPQKPGASLAGWNQWPEPPQAYNFIKIIAQHKEDQLNNGMLITDQSFLILANTTITKTIQEIQFRCSPWEGGLLWQPHSKPRAFVVPLTDHLPVLISVAYDPSQLVLKHLWIITRTD